MLFLKSHKQQPAQATLDCAKFPKL